MYRVTDPRHVYPIYRVELLAANPEEAARLVAEAMMGTSLDQVDDDVRIAILADLIVEPLPAA